MKRAVSILLSLILLLSLAVLPAQAADRLEFTADNGMKLPVGGTTRIQVTRGGAAVPCTWMPTDESVAKIISGNGTMEAVLQVLSIGKCALNGTTADGENVRSQVVYADPAALFTLGDGTVLSPEGAESWLLVPKGVDTIHMRVDPGWRVERGFFWNEAYAPDKAGGGDYTLTFNNSKMTGDPLMQFLRQMARETLLFKQMAAVNRPKDTVDDKKYLTGDYGTVSIKIPGAEGAATALTICWQVDLPELESLSADGADFYTPFVLADQIQRFVLRKGCHRAQINFTATPDTAKAFLQDGQGNTITGDGVITEKDGAFSFTVHEDDLDRRLILENEKGNRQVITFYGEPRMGDSPDAVVDYLCIGSQYSDGGNQLTGIYGLYPEKALIGNGSWSTPISLGNFGGYITFYYKEAIQNDPDNPYGIDFIVFGNSNGGGGFSEPGNVLVSEDGKSWYSLAGSEHYEDLTKWDYQVVYERDENGFTLANGVSIAPNLYPSPQNYPLYNWKPGEEKSITVTGVTPYARSGNGINGVGIAAEPSYFFPPFGYVDVRTNSSGSWGTGEINTVGNRAKNPYLPTTKQEAGLNGPANLDQIYEGAGDCYDLAWAVDKNGRPVSLGGIHYIKVQTASMDFTTGGIGEKSTEVNAVVRAGKNSSPVGVSRAPASISVGGVKLPLKEGVFQYATSVKGGFTVQVDAPGKSNVYINNKRSAERKFAMAPGKEIIRVIVQDGEKEPLIYYITVKGEPLTQGDIAAVIAAKSAYSGVGESGSPITCPAVIAALYELSAGDPYPCLYNGKWPFPQPPENDWCFDALNWGLAMKVVDESNGSFDGNSHITREQLAAMLYRLAFGLGRETPSGGGLERFGDAGKVSDGARDAVDWAFGNGVISPGAGGSIDPAGGVTKAEAAEILQRFFTSMVTHTVTT